MTEKDNLEKEDLTNEKFTSGDSIDTQEGEINGDDIDVKKKEQIVELSSEDILTNEISRGRSICLERSDKNINAPFITPTIRGDFS